MADRAQPLSARLDALMARLEALGDPKIRAIHGRHGADGPTLGVRIGDMKPLLTRAAGLKGDAELILALYDTGYTDAQYLAGLAAERDTLSEADLQRWVETAGSPMVAEYAVAWCAADSPFLWTLARRWMADPRDRVSSAAFYALSHHVAFTPDAALDLPALGALLQSVPERIGSAPNRTRAAQNGFVIAVGSFVVPLHAEAVKVAERLGTLSGPVAIDHGDTACKTPVAAAYIAKVVAAGRLGVKKKQLKC